MRKYNDKSNITGEMISKKLEEKNISQEDLCKKLQLLGINIDRVHLYRIMKGSVILKDFEFLAICKILNIDANEFKNLIEM